MPIENYYNSVFIIIEYSVKGLRWNSQKLIKYITGKGRSPEDLTPKTTKIRILAQNRSMYNNENFHFKKSDRN